MELLTCDRASSLMNSILQIVHWNKVHVSCGWRALVRRRMLYGLRKVRTCAGTEGDAASCSLTCCSTTAVRKRVSEYLNHEDAPSPKSPHLGSAHRTFDRIRSRQSMFSVRVRPWALACRLRRLRAGGQLRRDKSSCDSCTVYARRTSPRSIHSSSQAARCAR